LVVVTVFITREGEDAELANNDDTSVFTGPGLHDECFQGEEA
jgi:hypothetical protein